MPITLEKYIRDQLSKDRRTNAVEDIMIQFENQTQYYNDLTLTKVIQNTYATDMMHNTNTATDPQIDREVDNKINGELTKPPKKERQQNRHKTDEHCETNIQM